MRKRTLSLVVALVPLAALAGAIAAAPDRAPDALDAARPFYKLILENDAVRVFESSIPPGQTAPAHHLGCRVVYALAPIEERTTSLAGVTVDARKPFRAAWWRPAEDQAVTNVGAKNAFSLVVELKGAVPGGRGCSDAVMPAPAAVWATPANMTWATDDKGVARVRVIGNSADAGPFIQRTRFPAGYAGARHAHSVRVEATVIAGELRMRFDGNDQEVVLPAGSFVSVPAGLVHSESTAGGAEFEMRGEGPMATTQVK